MVLSISTHSATWFYCRDTSGADYLAAHSSRAFRFASEDAAHRMRESSRFAQLLDELAERVGEELRVSITSAERRAA